MWHHFRTGGWPPILPSLVLSQPHPQLPRVHVLSLTPPTFRPTHNCPGGSIQFSVRMPSSICRQSSISQRTHLKQTCCDRTHPSFAPWPKTGKYGSLSPSPGVWSSANSAIIKSTHLTLLSPRCLKLSKPWNPSSSQYQLCFTKFLGGHIRKFG